MACLHTELIAMLERPEVERKVGHTHISTYVTRI